MTCCNDERTEMTYQEPSGISQRAMQKWIRAPSPPVQIILRFAGQMVEVPLADNLRGKQVR